MAKSDDAAVRAVLEALARDGESATATLKRILTERDDALRRCASVAEAAVVSPHAPAPPNMYEKFVGDYQSPGKSEREPAWCEKHARQFRGAMCTDCKADAMDDSGADALNVIARRAAEVPS